MSTPASQFLPITLLLQLGDEAGLITSNCEWGLPVTLGQSKQEGEAGLRHSPCPLFLRHVFPHQY